MAFMMKKKRYKFTVHLSVDDLTAVPFVNAVLFVKVRLLDGGNFNETSSREEVKDHTVKWQARFEFVCKMSANANTSVLDPCILRISVRKELKGGRSFQKLGFTDLNLAEFAGGGETTRRCLLEGYDARHRQDNSMLRISIQLNMLSGDPVFKVPSPSLKQKPIVKQSPEEDDSSAATVASDRTSREDFSASGSVTSSFGSLPKKRPALFDKISSEASGGFVSSETGDGLGLTETDDTAEDLTTNCCNTTATTKNPSNITQNNVTKNSHSRQSSSGESGHVRSSCSFSSTRKLESSCSLAGYSGLLGGNTNSNNNSNGNNNNNNNNNSNNNNGGQYNSKYTITVTSSSATQCVDLSSSPDVELLPYFSVGFQQPHQYLNTTGSMTSSLISSNSRRTSQITLSNSSCLSETGSLDRGKSALERRKKAEENAPSGRVEITRVNPDNLIEQLIRSSNIEQSDDMIGSSGLQLFVSKDGTTALGGQDVKHQISTGVFKQVVMEEHR